jgi:phosphocarrier protein
LGSEIGIEIDGPDEQAAMTALRALIDDKFGEGG